MGDRALLVLGLEEIRTYLLPGRFQVLSALPGFVQDLALGAVVVSVIADLVAAIFLGNHRDVEVLPVPGLQQMTDEIILMEPLHDHDDHTVVSVVETGV
jgi:hypothetical protein